MTRYEKILLGLPLFAIGLASVRSSGGGEFFSFSVWLLALSYAVGGYWLFGGQKRLNDDQSPSARALGTLRVVTGISLALALWYTLKVIHLRQTPLNQLLPAAICCVGLAGYARWLHWKGGAPAVLRPLLIRAAVVLGLGLCFTVRPVDYAVGRALLIVLNRGDAPLISNVLMFEYGAQYVAARDQDAYARALRYAQQSVKAGKQWLEEDSIRGHHKISGVYQHLYAAYKQAGFAASSRQQFAEALHYYWLGHQVLVDEVLGAAYNPKTDAVWQQDQAASLTHLAYCTQKLGQFAQSDSLYVAAIEAYHKVHPKPTRDLAQLVADLAKSMSNRSMAGEANMLYRKANLILAGDTTQEASTALLRNELVVALNYLVLDSLTQATRTLSKLKPRPADSDGRAGIQFMRAITQSKHGRYLASNQSLRRCLPYYKSRRQPGANQAVCYTLLANNRLALADYAQAQAASATGLALAAKYKGTNSLQYAQSLQIGGAIHQAVADYRLADQQYAQALAIYQAVEPASPKLPGLLGQQAALLIHLGRYDDGRRTIGQARVLLNIADEKLAPSQSALLLTAAHLAVVTGQFQAAATQCRYVLAINKKYGQPQNSACAFALNDLLVTATAQNQLVAGDSALAAGLALREVLFPMRHPLTIALYVNGSTLRLQQHRFVEAAAMLQQAQHWAEALYPADHDVFGDVAAAQGNLARVRKQPREAQQYYQRAYEVYRHKFGPDHPKARQSQQKLA